MRRDPMCKRSGRPMHPFIAFPTKKSAVGMFARWYCPDCNRKVKMLLAGKRGHWYRVYTNHPREGVTKRQWQEWEGGDAMPHRRL